MLKRMTIHAEIPGKAPIHSVKVYHDAVNMAYITGSFLMINDLKDDWTPVREEDVPAVNANLAKKFGDPKNERVYVRCEDIEEETIIRCAEAFCEHHWNGRALIAVARELGIDLEELKV